MKNVKPLVFVILFFLISFVSLKAQITLQEYLDLEEIRLFKADSINNNVNFFITDSLTNFSLTQNEINDITDDLYNIHDGSSSPIIGSDVDSVILKAKKIKLFNIYFNDNPNDTIFFTKTPIPNNLKQQCFNGDFIYGYAGYQFRKRVVYPSTHMSNVCSVNNLPTSFTPSFINSFNSTATLVSPGDEPYLNSLGININRVPTFTGAIRSLKLNPTPTSYSDSQTGNQTSVSKNFIINESQINFSFLQFGHVRSSSGSGHYHPGFRYRIIDNNTGNILKTECYSIETNDCRYEQIQDNLWNPNQTNTLAYSPKWICESIDTSDLIGLDVTLEFLASDCGYRGHFSTVYIANICGVTCSPTWGFLNINEINLNCPESSFDVCGNFELPEGETFNSLTLNIIDNSLNSIYQINNPTITNNDFCFSIDPLYFGIDPTDTFSFEVILNNSSNCDELSTMVETGGNITFNDCINCDDIIPDISFIYTDELNCNATFTGVNLGTDCPNQTYSWEIFNDGTSVYTTTGNTLYDTDFDFTANQGNYTITLTITGPNTSNSITTNWILPDDCYIDPCDLSALDAHSDGTNIVWNDIATTYTLEFYSDARCLREDLDPGWTSDGTIQPITNHTIVTSSSSINIYNDVIIPLDRDSFRWRIKADDCEWSDWCCLTSKTGSAIDDFGNIYGTECFPATPCDNFDNNDPMLSSPIDDVLSGNTTNYDTYVNITATNNIESNANSTYRASNSINLLPGFHANNNSNFRAYLEDCVLIIGSGNGNKNSNTLDKTSEIENEEKINIFPNPAKSILNIKSNKDMISYELFNIQGQKVITNTVKTNEQKINVSDLSRGIYLLKVTLENEKSIIKKIILD